MQTIDMTPEEFTSVIEIAAKKALPPPAARKALRLGAGLTLQEVADVVGVAHRSTVLRWETGGRTPRGADRVAYANALREMREVISDG